LAGLDNDARAAIHDCSSYAVYVGSARGVERDAPVVFNGAFAFRLTKWMFRQPLAREHTPPQRARLSG
jgi:hypothetical protein